MLQEITTEQNVRYIIENNIKYIDKTRVINKLIQSKRSVFFSKPRRFWKSMLISTLFEIFSGNKDLFKDLYIWQTDYSFEEFPIIHISFANFDTKYNPYIYEYLDKSIKITYKWKKYNIKDFWYSTSGDGLFSLWDLSLNIYETLWKPVVLLVDEYDKIATANFDDQWNINKYISVISWLFSWIKDANADGYIRFTLISWLTKILSNDLFSTLNHLNDISNDYNYYELAWYTKQEIIDNFWNDYLPLLASNQNRSIDEELEQIRYFYNGYNFWEDNDLIYNPYSINLLFQKQKYDLYWANTWRAQLVVDYISNISNDEYIRTIDDIRNWNIVANSKDIFILDKSRVNLIGLLYQVWYLTIQEWVYRIPNREAEFCLIEDFTQIAFNYNSELLNIFSNSGKYLTDWIFNNNQRLIESWLVGLERVLLNINPKWYQHNPEWQLKWYLYNTLLISWLTPYRTVSQEEITNNGFSDIVIRDNRLKTFIIIEAKWSEWLNGALKQVRDQYIDFYINQWYKVILFWIKWNSKNHNITYDINYDFCE